MDMQYQYLDSLGNMFLNAARGQKQIEEFSRLMGFSSGNFQNWSETAGKFFGFDTLAQSTTEIMRFYRKLFEEFQQSIKGILSLMDLVPKRDYLDLLGQYEDLKKKTREAGTAGLKNILQEGLSLQSEGLQRFEELARKQTEDFQNLMASFNRALTETSRMTSSSTPEQGAETQKATQTKRRSSSARKGSSSDKETNQ